MALGQGAYRYERALGWGKIPPYFKLTGLGPVATGGIVDVACDAHDRVYALCRGNHPVLIFDPDGNFVSCWGEGHFLWPHGITIDAQDHIYIADAQKHTVEKFTLGGELLMTLGTPGWAAVTMRGEPFNMPTGTAIAPDGSLFISDGYGNRRVHHFTADGRLLHSWGAPGSAPGEFILPHFLDVDRHGTVYVCDRENDRIQLFTAEGAFVRQWTGLVRPADVYIDREKDIVYVSQLGGASQPKISIHDLQGNVLSFWEGREREGKGVLNNPHGIGVDSKGNIYEASIGERPGIQKFVKLT